MYNVGIFLFNDIELLDFAGPYEVFSVASELNNHQLFRVFTFSEDGQAVRSVNGLQVTPDFSFRNHPPVDLFVLPGGIGTKAEITKRPVLDWIYQIQQRSQWTMSVCSGARLLGKLGLLDGLESVTHHEVIPHLCEIAPQTIINENARFIDNGRILTSAGISAGIDLSLYLVERLCGRAVAHQTIVYMEYGNWEALR